MKHPSQPTLPAGSSRNACSYSPMLRPYHQRYTCIQLRLSSRALYWLEELYQRSVIINELIAKGFQQTMFTIDEFYPNLKYEDNYCRICLKIRVAAFQRFTIYLLFPDLRRQVQQ
jgi:hypothetical protein